MKKLIYLLILIPFISFAKFYSGIMTFTDNTTKEGFIEIPDDSENNTIKFRLEEKGNTEKFPLEQIKSFVINNENGDKIKFVTTHLAYFKPFSKDNSFKVHKKLACVEVIKEGKINLYSAWYITTGPKYGSIIVDGNYFINRGNDYSLVIYENDGAVNAWKYFLSLVEKHFNEECPNLVKLVNKDDFKKNGLGRIVELYEQNCGK